MLVIGYAIHIFHRPYLMCRLLTHVSVSRKGGNPPMYRRLFVGPCFRLAIKEELGRGVTSRWCGSGLAEFWAQRAATHHDPGFCGVRCSQPGAGCGFHQGLSMAAPRQGAHACGPSRARAGICRHGRDGKRDREPGMPAKAMVLHFRLPRRRGRIVTSRFKGRTGPAHSARARCTETRPCWTWQGPCTALMPTPRVKAGVGIWGMFGLALA